MRISATEIDSFRYWKDSDLSLEDFLKRLRHEEPPTRAMMAGRALHKILERASMEPEEVQAEVASADGFTFRFAADCTLPLLPVAELKGEMEIQTSSGPVTLVGIVDGFDGEVYDHKLTERFDAERYAASFQWRIYLVLFGSRRFTYNVFEGAEDLEEWVIHGFQQLTFYAYDGMREDVVREVSDLAAFIAEHLPERVAA